MKSNTSWTKKSPQILLLVAASILWFSVAACLACAAGRRIPLQLAEDDVLSTGNEWISLPDIRAEDGALHTFNVLSMRSRGLIEVRGADGAPVLQPYFVAGGKPLRQNPLRLLFRAGVIPA
jgi:hypothetical protein